MASQAAEAARAYRAALKVAERCSEADGWSASHDGCDRGEHLSAATALVCAGALVASEWPYETYEYADGSRVVVSDYDARVSRRALATGMTQRELRQRREAAAPPQPPVHIADDETGMARCGSSSIWSLYADDPAFSGQTVCPEC